MRVTVEELTGASVRLIESLARTVERLSTALIYFVAIPAAITISMTIVAARGANLVFSLVLLGLVSGVGLAAAVIARSRFRAVTRRAPQLARELHDLLSSDAAARAAIDTYVVEDGAGERFVADLRSPEAVPRAGGMVRSARTLLKVRRFVGDNMDRFSTITAAVSAAKLGPWLVLTAAGAALYLTFVAMISLFVAGFVLIF